MTREEAFKLLCEGKRMTHKNFTRDEYMHMPNKPQDLRIFGEDGCVLTNPEPTTTP